MAYIFCSVELQADNVNIFKNEKKLSECHYIVIDDAPTHTAKEIDKLITKRGYKSIYLPLYSPELNPIEQLWAIVKNKVKRSRFEDKADLFTRITEACNSIPPNHLHAFAQQSVNVFEKCLNEEPI